MARDDEYVICPHCGNEGGEVLASNLNLFLCNRCGQQYMALAEHFVPYVATAQAPYPKGEA